MKMRDGSEARSKNLRNEDGIFQTKLIGDVPVLVKDPAFTNNKQKYRTEWPVTLPPKVLRDGFAVKTDLGSEIKPSKVYKTDYTTFTYFITSLLGPGITTTSTDIIISSNVITDSEDLVSPTAWNQIQGSYTDVTEVTVPSGQTFYTKLSPGLQITTKTYFTTSTFYSTFLQNDQTLTRTRTLVQSSISTETPSLIPGIQNDIKYLSLGSDIYGKIKTIFATYTYLTTDLGGEVGQSTRVITQLSTSLFSTSSLPQTTRVQLSPEQLLAIKESYLQNQNSGNYSESNGNGNNVSFGNYGESVQINNQDLSLNNKPNTGGNEGTGSGITGSVFETASGGGGLESPGLNGGGNGGGFAQNQGINSNGFDGVIGSSGLHEGGSVGGVAFSQGINPNEFGGSNGFSVESQDISSEYDEKEAIAEEEKESENSNNFDNYENVGLLENPHKEGSIKNDGANYEHNTGHFSGGSLTDIENNKEDNHNSAANSGSYGENSRVPSGDYDSSSSIVKPVQSSIIDSANYNDHYKPMKGESSHGAVITTKPIESSITSGLILDKDYLSSLKQSFVESSKSSLSESTEYPPLPESTKNPIGDINLPTKGPEVILPPTEIGPTATTEGFPVVRPSELVPIGVIGSGIADNDDGEAESSTYPPSSGGVINAVVGGIAEGLGDVFGGNNGENVGGLKVDLGPVLDAVAILLRGPIRSAIANRRSEVVEEKYPEPSKVLIPSEKKFIPVGGLAKQGIQGRTNDYEFIPLQVRKVDEKPENYPRRKEGSSTSPELHLPREIYDAINRHRSSKDEPIYLDNNRLIINDHIIHTNDPLIIDVLNRFEQGHLFGEYRNKPMAIKILPGQPMTTFQKQVKIPGKPIKREDIYRNSDDVGGNTQIVGRPNPSSRRRPSQPRAPPPHLRNNRPRNRIPNGPGNADPKNLSKNNYPKGSSFHENNQKIRTHSKNTRPFSPSSIAQGQRGPHHKIPPIHLSNDPKYYHHRPHGNGQTDKPGSNIHKPFSLPGGNPKISLNNFSKGPRLNKRPPNYPNANRYPSNNAGVSKPDFPPYHNLPHPQAGFNKHKEKGRHPNLKPNNSPGHRSNYPYQESLSAPSSKPKLNFGRPSSQNPPRPLFPQRPKNIQGSPSNAPRPQGIPRPKKQAHPPQSLSIPPAIFPHPPPLSNHVNKPHLNLNGNFIQKPHSPPQLPHSLKNSILPNNVHGKNTHQIDHSNVFASNDERPTRYNVGGGRPIDVSPNADIIDESNINTREEFIQSPQDNPFLRPGTVEDAIISAEDYKTPTDRLEIIEGIPKFDPDSHFYSLSSSRAEPFNPTLSTSKNAIIGTGYGIIYGNNEVRDMTITDSLGRTQIIQTKIQDPLNRVTETEVPPPPRSEIQVNKLDYQGWQTNYEESASVIRPTSSFYYLSSDKEAPKTVTYANEWSAYRPEQSRVEEFIPQRRPHINTNFDREWTVREGNLKPTRTQSFNPPSSTGYNNEWSEVSVEEPVFQISDENYNQNRRKEEKEFLPNEEIPQIKISTNTPPPSLRSETLPPPTYQNEFFIYTTTDKIPLDENILKETPQLPTTTHKNEWHKDFSYIQTTSATLIAQKLPVIVKPSPIQRKFSTTTRSESSLRKESFQSSSKVLPPGIEPDTGTFINIFPSSTQKFSPPSRKPSKVGYVNSDHIRKNVSPQESRFENGNQRRYYEAEEEYYYQKGNKNIDPKDTENIGSNDIEKFLPGSNIEFNNTHETNSQRVGSDTIQRSALNKDVYQQSTEHKESNLHDSNSKHSFKLHDSQNKNRGNLHENTANVPSSVQTPKEINTSNDFKVRSSHKKVERPVRKISVNQDDYNQNPGVVRNPSIVKPNQYNQINPSRPPSQDILENTRPTNPDDFSQNNFKPVNEGNLKQEEKYNSDGFYKNSRNQDYNLLNKDNNNEQILKFNPEKFDSNPIYSEEDHYAPGMNYEEYNISQSKEQETRKEIHQQSGFHKLNGTDISLIKNYTSNEDTKANSDNGYNFSPSNPQNQNFIHERKDEVSNNGNSNAGLTYIDNIPSLNEHQINQGNDFSTQAFNTEKQINEKTSRLEHETQSGSFTNQYENQSFNDEDQFYRLEEEPTNNEPYKNEGNRLHNKIEIGAGNRNSETSSNVGDAGRGNPFIYNESSGDKLDLKYNGHRTDESVVGQGFKNKNDRIDYTERNENNNREGNGKRHELEYDNSGFLPDSEDSRGIKKENNFDSFKGSIKKLEGIPGYDADTNELRAPANYPSADNTKRNDNRVSFSIPTGGLDSSKQKPFYTNSNNGFIDQTPLTFDDRIVDHSHLGSSDAEVNSYVNENQGHNTDVNSFIPKNNEHSPDQKQQGFFKENISSNRDYVNERENEYSSQEFDDIQGFKNKNPNDENSGDKNNVASTEFEISSVDDKTTFREHLDKTKDSEILNFEYSDGIPYESNNGNVGLFATGYSDEAGLNDKNNPNEFDESNLTTEQGYIEFSPVSNNQSNEDEEALASLDAISQSNESNQIFKAQNIGFNRGESSSFTSDTNLHENSQNNKKFSGNSWTEPSAPFDKEHSSSPSVVYGPYNNPDQFYLPNHVPPLKKPIPNFEGPLNYNPNFIGPFKFEGNLDNPNIRPPPPPPGFQFLGPLVHGPIRFSPKPDFEDEKIENAKEVSEEGKYDIIINERQPINQIDESYNNEEILTTATPIITKFTTTYPSSKKDLENIPIGITVTESDNDKFRYESEYNVRTTSTASTKSVKNIVKETTTVSTSELPTFTDTLPTTYTNILYRSTTTSPNYFVPRSNSTKSKVERVPLSNENSRIRIKETIDKKIRRKNPEIIRDQTINNNIDGAIVESIPGHSLTAEELDPETKCQNACGENELCRIKPGGGVVCKCRPGFGKAAGSSSKCGKSKSYEIEVITTSESEEITIVKLSPKAVEKAVADTYRRNIKDLYFGSQITSIKVGNNTKRNVFFGGEKNLTRDDEMSINMIVHIADDGKNSSEEVLKSVLETPIKDTKLPLGADVTVSRVTIEDFNECTHPEHNDCSDQAECHNIKGSYTCACKNGYHDLSGPNILSGRVCLATTTECDLCNKHGNCIAGEIVTCECQPWFAGKNCQINMKLLLIVGCVSVGLMLVIACGVSCFCCKDGRNSKQSIPNPYGAGVTPIPAAMRGHGILMDPHGNMKARSILPRPYPSRPKRSKRSSEVSSFNESGSGVWQSTFQGVGSTSSSTLTKTSKKSGTIEALNPAILIPRAKIKSKPFDDFISEDECDPPLETNRAMSERMSLASRHRRRSMPFSFGSTRSQRGGSVDPLLDGSISDDSNHQQHHIRSSNTIRSVTSEAFEEPLVTRGGRIMSGSISCRSSRSHATSDGGRTMAERDGGSSFVVSAARNHQLYRIHNINGSLESL